jgi:transcriptional regulator with XRE-family HTH domain
MSSDQYSSDEQLGALSANLRKIRKSGLFGNYRKMAGVLRISKQHLSDIVNRRKAPSDKLIEFMAQAFKVPREKLLSTRDLVIVAEPSEVLTPEKRELLEKVNEIIQKPGRHQLVTALLTMIKADEACREDLER